MSFSLKTILALAATTTAAVLPRQGGPVDWSITDFSVFSHNGGSTHYSLNINVGSETVYCSTENDVPGAQCVGQTVPAPFPLSTCGSTGIEWQLSNTTSPLQGGGEVFFIQFRQLSDGKTMYGCSPAFDASDYTCTAQGYASGETLNVPSSFTVQPTSNDQCVYV